jgi:hypothetical protein
LPPDDSVAVHGEDEDIYMNQTNIYEGSTAVVEHKDKDQAAVQEIAGLVILCGHQAYKRNAYQEHSHSLFTMMQGRGCERMVYWQGKQYWHNSSWIWHVIFASKVIDVHEEKLRQVRSSICMNRREITCTRFEAIAGAYNSHSLLALFGRGHLAIKAGGAIYVTRCAPVEIQKLPRGNTCPDE